MEVSDYVSVCNILGYGIEQAGTEDIPPNWIEVSSYKYEVSGPDAGATYTDGAGTRGRRSHGDLEVSKAPDKTSPKLALFYCNAKHID